MFLDHRFELQSGKVREFISVIIYPVRSLVDLPITTTRSVGDYFSTQKHLVAENRAMREENLLLHGKLQRLEALETEIQHLRQLSESGSHVTDGLKIANIINIDPDPFTRQIIINRGENQGAYVGQVIIDSDGIMGTIIKVQADESRAILITDASHAVPVENVRNGLRAIAVGTGSGGLELRHVPTSSDITVGDVMITSGLGGRFPVGFPVGKVKDVKQEPNKAFATIVLDPSAKLDRGRHILLLQNSKQRSKDKGK